MTVSIGADPADTVPRQHLRRLVAVDRTGLALTIVAVLGALIWGFPIYFSIFETLKPRGDAVSLSDWVVDVGRLYGRVIFETDLGRWYLNSIVTSAGVTLGVILISAACGYAISQLRFRGSRVLWFLILASFMISIQALIVGHFFLMYNFGLINTWLGVILPQLIAPVAVIVYKQFFNSVPRELREAAMLDGASHSQILFRIYLPTNWGVTAALAIITFIGAWNAFLWPFLAVTTEPMMNVAVAMGANFTALGENYLAASLLAGLPVALVYLLFQRRVTQAVMLSSGLSSR